MHSRRVGQLQPGWLDGLLLTARERQSPTRRGHACPARSTVRFPVTGLNDRIEGPLVLDNAAFQSLARRVYLGAGRGRRRKLGDRLSPRSNAHTLAALYLREIGRQVLPQLSDLDRFHAGSLRTDEAYTLPALGSTTPVMGNG